VVLEQNARILETEVASGVLECQLDEQSRPFASRRILQQCDFQIPVSKTE